MARTRGRVEGGGWGNCELTSKSSRDVCNLIRLQALIKFKSYLYFEEKDHVDKAEKSLKLMSPSRVRRHFATRQKSQWADGCSSHILFAFCWFFKHR